MLVYWNLKLVPPMHVRECSISAFSSNRLHEAGAFFERVDQREHAALMESLSLGRGKMRFHLYTLMLQCLCRPLFLLSSILYQPIRNLFIFSSLCTDARNKIKDKQACLFFSFFIGHCFFFFFYCDRSFVLLKAWEQGCRHAVSLERDTRACVLRGCRATLFRALPPLLFGGWCSFAGSCTVTLLNNKSVLSCGNPWSSWIPSEMVAAAIVLTRQR